MYPISCSLKRNVNILYPGFFPNTAYNGINYKTAFKSLLRCENLAHYFEKKKFTERERERVEHVEDMGKVGGDVEQQENGRDRQSGESILHENGGDRWYQ